MTLLDLKGRPKTVKNIRRYFVDWNGGTRSKGQTALKKFLYPYWKNDIICEEFPLVGTKMSYDIINLSKKIAVEFDGAMHHKHIPHFHGKNPAGKFLGQIKRDLKKEDWCEINNFTLVRVNNEKELNYEFFYERGVIL